MSTPFVAETTFHVRYAETDAQQVVHHANYLVYFEEGRSDYIRQRGRSYADFEQQGFFLIVAEAGLRYARAARYDQRLTIRTWIAEVKSRGLTYQYQVLAADTREILVTGFTRHLCITRSGQVTRIPDEWRTWIGS
ncbi:MAG: acyl-CoA thioesterase [Chloroflexi bacterium]|nr:acyl-CoA thioesterase [Chloroflexota bacterium]